MANLVVAVGTLLAVLGSWAVYFGYTIVQVERGWATMIAGAAVLSGGAVTAALGLVLRRLTVIQAALKPRSAARAPAAHVESHAPPPQLEFALVPPVSPHMDRIVEPALSPPSPHVAEVPRETAVVHQDDAHPAPAETVAPDPEYDGVDDAWRAVDAELQRTDWSAMMHTPDAPPEPRFADEVLPHETAHTHAASYEPEAPEAHVPPPLHVAQPEPVEAAHPEPPPFTPEAAPLAAPPVAAPAYGAAESEFEDDYEDLLVHAKAKPTSPHPGVDAPEPAAGTAPVETPGAPEPHVIGKYDADGTTYTMFSDGSIEAHSPDGIYQFGSMAELKAFIERVS